MLRSLLIILCFSLSYSHIFCQSYAISQISSDLAEDAKAVVRLDETHLHLQDYDKLTVYRNQIITIYKPEGDYYRYLPMHYDEHTHLITYSGEVYDKSGKLIKKLKKKDLKDYSAVPNGTLYSENRVKIYDYTPTQYPYTIQLSYEYITSNTAFIPNWFPVNNYDISIEKSEYKLINDSNVKLNTFEENFESFPNLVAERSGNIISYKIQNLKPFKDEVLSPPLSHRTPKAFLTLEKFKLAGEDGKFTNWKEFGQWMYQDLIKDRQSLPAREQKNISQLTANLDSDIEKVKVLYQYMQDKTRYINVAIGIGGWQPYPATYVSNKGYGDCKALSNYMMALLKEAGIPSNYTIVYGDRDEVRHIKPDFTAMQGNHVILHVPLENDTIWLECTNQKTAFNHLGGFTNNRYALSINDKGGEIVKTQNYPFDKNKDEINGWANISTTGSLDLNFIRKLSGLQYDWGYGITYEAEHDQINYLLSWYDEIKNAQFKSFEFTNHKDSAIFSQKIHMVAENFGQINKNNLIFPILPINRLQTSLKKDLSREQPVLIKEGYTDNYKFRITLPKDFKLNYAINPIVLDTEFGMYSLQVNYDDQGDLLVNRKLVIHKGTYPKEKFNAYVKFRKKIAKADNTKILLEKLN